MLDQKYNSNQKKFLHPDYFSGKIIFNNRFIFQNGPAPKNETPSDKPADKPTDKPVDTKTENKTEVIDQRIDAKKVAVDQMQTSIQTANCELKSVEGKLTPATQKYLEDYFAGAIDRFDKDKDGKISAEEAVAYKAEMAKKTQDFLKEYMPNEEQKKAKLEKDAAAAAVEKKESKEDTDKNVAEIKAIPGDLDIKDSKDVFDGLVKQNSSFLNSINSSLENVSAFEGGLKTFEAGQKGFSAVKHAWNEFFSHDAEEQKYSDIQKKLADAKADAQSKLTDLTAKKAILDANSEKLKAAVAKARQQIIDDRDAKVAEIKETETKQGEEVDAKKKRYAELQKTQTDLETQKKGLLAKQEHTAEFRKNWIAVQSAEIKQIGGQSVRVPIDNEQAIHDQWVGRKQAFDESKKDADLEIQAYQQLLDDPRVSDEYKTKIKEELDKAKNRGTSAETNSRIIDERTLAATKVHKQLNDDEKANLAQVNSVEGYLKGQVEPSLASTSDTIDKLEDLKLQYATKGTEVADYYNKKVEAVDKVSETINDFALNSAVGREKSIGALQSSVDALSKVSIDNSGRLSCLFGAGVGIWQGTLDGFTHGCKWLAEKIDGNTAYLTDGDHGVGWKVLGQVGGLFTGFVSGGLDLLGGVGTMLSHPVNTLVGLGGLIGRDPATGEWSPSAAGATWKGLVNAIFSIDEYKKGHVGTATGKIAFNVLSLLVGGGAAEGADAVGVLGEAAEAANAARALAVSEALVKGVEISGRGAYVWQFAKTAAFSGLKSAIPKFVKGSYAEAAEAEGILAKTTTFAKGVGKGLVDNAPQFVKDAYDAGKAGKGVLGTSYNVTKSLAYTGLKTVGRTVQLAGELLTFPLKVIGKAPEAFESLAKSVGVLKNEGLVGAYRANKISKAAEVLAKEGGQYAKAREAISDIIAKDPELTRLAETDAKGAQLANDKAVLKLRETDPKLFHSYSAAKEAVETIQEQSGKISGEVKANAQKIKDNPEYSLPHKEYEQLSEEYNTAFAEQQKLKGKPGYDAAKDRFDKADEALHQFEQTDGAKVRKYRDADRIQKDIDAIMADRKDLAEGYLKAPHESLAKLESEVGEAKLAAGNNPAAISDTPEYIKGLYEDYQAAFKSGPAEFQKAKSAFGTVEAGSELDTQLQYLERKFKGEKVVHPGNDPAFNQKYGKQFNEAMKNGDLNSMKSLRNDPAAAIYKDYFDALEFNYRTNPKNLAEVFKRNQESLSKAYEEYSKAAELGDDAAMQKIRADHPSWKEGLDEFDKRRTYLNRDQLQARKMAEIRIKSDLPALEADWSNRPIVGKGKTANEVATELEAKYKTQPKGVGATKPYEIPLSKPLLDGEAYIVRFETTGEVRLVNETTGEVVPTVAEAKAAAKALKKGAAPKVAPSVVSSPALPPGPPGAPQLGPYRTPTLRALPPGAPAEFVEYNKLTYEADAAALEVSKIKNAKLAPLEVAEEARFGSHENFEAFNKYFADNPHYLTEAELKTLRQQMLDDDILMGMHDKSDLINHVEEITYKLSESPGVRSVDRLHALEVEDFNAQNAKLSFEQDAARLKIAKDYEASLPPPPEPAKAFQEYKGLQDKVADSQKSVDAYGQHKLPDIDKSKYKGPLDPSRLPEVESYLNLNFEHLTEQELLALRKEMLADKDLAKITGPGDFSNKMADLEQAFAKKVGAEARFKTAKAAFQTAEDELAVFKSDDAKFTAAKDFEATQSPAPAEASLEPKLNPAERVKKAVDQMNQDKAALKMREKELKIDRDNLKASEKNLLERKKSGKLSKQALEGLENKVQGFRDAVTATEGKIKALEDAISTARKDKYIAKAAGYKDYLISPLRSEMLQNAKNTLSKLKGLPGKAARDLIEFIEKEIISGFDSFDLINKRNFTFSEKMKTWWHRARNKSGEVLSVYNNLMDDRMRMIRTLGMINEKQMAEFAAMSTEQKMTAMKNAFSTAARDVDTADKNTGMNGAGGAFATNENFYTDADLDYINEDKKTIRDAINSVRGQSDLTAETLQAAIDSQLGPEGTNIGKSYSITLDGITVKVDKSGHRTYEGLEKYFIDEPNKKLTGQAFREVSLQYNDLDPKSVLALNNGKPFASKEELRKQVEQKLIAEIGKKLAGQDLKDGLKVFSATSLKGEPNFIATISKEGEIKITLSDKWIDRTFDKAAGKTVDPIEGPSLADSAPDDQATESNQPAVSEKSKSASKSKSVKKDSDSADAEETEDSEKATAADLPTASPLPAQPDLPTAPPTKPPTESEQALIDMLKSSSPAKKSSEKPAETDSTTT